MNTTPRSRSAVAPTAGDDNTASSLVLSANAAAMAASRTARPTGAGAGSAAPVPRSGGRKAKAPTAAPFLIKTFDILDNPAFRHLVSWNPTGNGILVHNVPEFAAHVLPLYFKHRRWSSFVRQLHIYGFKKIMTPGQVGSVSKKVEFRNPRFLQGSRDNLASIRRRVIPTSSGVAPDAAGGAGASRPKKRRRTTKGRSSLNPDQVKAMTLALARQQELLQRVERLEGANRHLSAINDCLSWELLRLKHASRLTAGRVCQAASRMCTMTGVALFSELRGPTQLAAQGAAKAGVSATVGAAGVITTSTTAPAARVASPALRPAAAPDVSMT